METIENLIKLKNLVFDLEERWGPSISQYSTGKNFFDVQIRSYAYSIIVMQEVICLLEKGFPDGALARARRLYEQMIILDFLDVRQNEKDFSKMIERYCDAQDIEAYSAQVEMCEFFENFTEKEKAETALKKVKDNNKKTLDLFSKHNNYWWTGNKKFSSFNRIQKSYNDKFLKLLYRRACISTHACALGDYALIGRYNPNGELIYTGPTQDGFEMPLVLAILSFYNLTNKVFKNMKIEAHEEMRQLQDFLEFYTKNLLCGDYNLDKRSNVDGQD